jgi:uncharacterized membrane protein YecN with MAPEG domain
MSHWFSPSHGYCPLSLVLLKNMTLMQSDAWLSHYWWFIKTMGKLFKIIASSNFQLNSELYEHTMDFNTNTEADTWDALIFWF